MQESTLRTTVDETQGQNGVQACNGTRNHKEPTNIPKRKRTKKKKKKKKRLDMKEINIVVRRVEV